MDLAVWILSAVRRPHPFGCAQGRL